MISTSGDNASLAGGSIDGDLTITGDFKVEGGGSFTYDEIVEGTMQVTHSGGDGVEAIQIVNTNGSPGSFSWATTAIQDDMANSQRYLHLIGKAESSYN